MAVPRGGRGGWGGGCLDGVPCPFLGGAGIAGGCRCGPPTMCPPLGHRTPRTHRWTDTGRGRASAGSNGTRPRRVSQDPRLAQATRPTAGDVPGAELETFKREKEELIKQLCHHYVPDPKVCVCGVCVCVCVGGCVCSTQHRSFSGQVPQGGFAGYNICSPLPRVNCEGFHKPR